MEIELQTLRSQFCTARRSHGLAQDIVDARSSYTLICNRQSQ